MTISPPKFDFKGDREKSIALKPQARQFYNFIINQAELGGLNSISRSVVLPDGSTISVYSKKEGNYGNRTGVITIITSSSTSRIINPRLYVSFYDSLHSYRRKYYKENINSGYLTEASSVGRYAGFSFNYTNLQENFTVGGGYWTDYDKKAFRYDNISSGTQSIYINGNIVTLTGIPTTYSRPLYTLRDDKIYGIFLSLSSNAIVKYIGLSTSSYSVAFSSLSTLFTIPDSVYESQYYRRNSFDKEGLTIWLNRDKLLSFLPDFSNYYTTPIVSTRHSSIASSDTELKYGIMHPSQKGYCGFSSGYTTGTSTFTNAYFYEIQITYSPDKSSISQSIQFSGILPSLVFTSTSGGTVAGHIETAYPLAYCSETNTSFYHLISGYQKIPGINSTWYRGYKLIKSVNGSKVELYSRENISPSPASTGDIVERWTSWAVDRFMYGFSVASTSDIFCLNSSTVANLPVYSIFEDKKAVFLLQSKTTGAIESTWDYNLSFRPAQGLTVSN